MLPTIRINRILKAQLLLFLTFFTCCNTDPKERKLMYEEGKKFRGISIKKIWEGELYGRMVLALPQGILLDEIQDKIGNKHKLMLFDYKGNLIKEKILLSGEGPNEVKVLSLENVWISLSGKIMCQDNNYLKTLDPTTFEIETLKKISNAIDGYGSKYTFGRHGYTTFEEKENKTVTTFESTGYFENLTYYIASYDHVFENFSIICETKKPLPLMWEKLRERKGESITDYYHFLRMYRIFSVDWNRGVVFFIPDIEKPEINSVDLITKKLEQHNIDIDNKKFRINKKELELEHEYVLSQTSAQIKRLLKQILHIPPYAPALMGIKVIEDKLIIISGKRDWDEQENEALVYSLPAFKFEGSFSIPYPNMLRTKWYDKYYIIEKLIKQSEEYIYYWEIYHIEIN
jgi:hypothetical protein